MIVSLVGPLFLDLVFILFGCIFLYGVMSLKDVISFVDILYHTIYLLPSFIIGILLVGLASYGV